MPNPKDIWLYQGLNNRVKAEERTGGGNRDGRRRTRQATRARTHDGAGAPEQSTATLRASAIFGLCKLYGRGLVTADKLLDAVADIIAEPKE